MYVIICRRLSLRSIRSQVVYSQLKKHLFLRLQHNVRFFLEILQNRKSDTLEWIIILLITGEICVGVYQILLETNVL